MSRSAIRLKKLILKKYFCCTIVTLYKHNNNSFAVVQNVSRARYGNM